MRLPNLVLMAVASIVAAAAQTTAEALFAAIRAQDLPTVSGCWTRIRPLHLRPMTGGVRQS
jgi:hypothetical protein